MADIYYNEEKGEWTYRQKLRSPFIDYCHGWFFVTFQVAGNKSALGAVVGDECVLNELGRAVHDAWISEPEHVAGLQVFDFQVMPNHFHALLYYQAVGAGDRNTIAVGAVADGLHIAPCRSPVTAPETCGLLPRNRVAAKYARDANARDLAYVIGLFKSWTTTLYHRLKANGRCIDIGPKLWQESFYDELVRSAKQFKQTAAYIRNNPANWNIDRFGPVTSFFEGNIELLKSAYIAYLSSEGYAKDAASSETPMKKLAVGAVADGLHGLTNETPETQPPVISTFTSFYERQILERCLHGNRRFIWVCPGGISAGIRAKAADALASARALLISPVASETGINKQRANWCNQFIVKNATEIWLGHIRPGGSLESILKACGKGI